jgi:tricorn protease
MDRLLFSLGLALLAAAPAAAVDVRDTRLLSQPAVSASHIAFCYADDLWVCDLDGRNVRRLTSDVGMEHSPVFSPDGRTLAFTGQYEGNADVYIIPVEGGQPTRLTWHPGPDVVRGWTPDSSAVLFSSNRSVSNNRHQQLFTVPVAGGMPTQLPIPSATEASLSPDGSRIAYTPLSDATRQWKHYRGGTHGRIWVLKLDDLAVEQVEQPKDRCNDNCPRWMDNTVYFRSDRNGEYNLFGYDVEGKELKQLTRFADFPVMGIAAGGGNVVFEQAGYLHRYDKSTGRTTRLAIGVPADLPERRPRFARGAKYVRSAGISPSGARAVFEYRGEIVTVPAEKGDPRNLTQSVGAHERDPAWSPDGKQVAYFSDAGGEYQLQLRRADGKGEPKPYKLKGAGFYEMPVWSPDGKKIAYRDNSQTLYFIELDGGRCTRVAGEPLYSPIRFMRFSWSPDSQYLAYSLGTKTGLNRIHIHSLKDGESRAVTDPLSDSLEPCFDAGGKYLYFSAATDAGPVNQWFSQASADMRSKRNLYLCVLKKGMPSPFAKESDEEKGKEDSKDDGDKKPKDGDKKDDGEKKAKDEKKPVEIDFDGIMQRVVAFPMPASGYNGLAAGAPGQLCYMKADAVAIGDEDFQGGGELHRYDLSKRKGEKVGPECVGFRLTPDGKKVLTMSRPKGAGPEAGMTFTIGELGGPPDSAKPVAVDRVEVRVNPPEEWAQVLREAWRINRDYFYVPNMHGADWPAVLAKYQEFVPHLATRGDLDRVIQWMLSELAVGHSYTSPGERPNEVKRVPGGLLGADYDVADGRYRFKKVYGGLNWNPDLRAPLTAPGVDVKAGEFLLAVQGKELKAPTNLFSLFENTANKSIEITVGPNADGTGARTVTVEPVANEGALRNRAWVEGNLRKVHEATNGRAAYVYVPNTAGSGHEYFKRYFYPQTDKEAIIIDERFNGGGSLADYYIDHLRRNFTANWTTRYGDVLKTPQATIDGPKVMLIDETAGSGGDFLPWLFRQYKLGPLVGKRTWGGLVGILGFPVLMDGGRVTAPDIGFWTEKEGYGIENVGVPADIEVEQWPAEVAKGRDPQLERAIKYVMDELEKKPAAKEVRPENPVRVKKAG